MALNLASAGLLLEPQRRCLPLGTQFAPPACIAEGQVNPDGPCRARLGGLQDALEALREGAIRVRIDDVVALEDLGGVFT